MNRKRSEHSNSDYRSAALSDLHNIIWSLLREVVQDASSAFHTPALATIGDDGPEVRTVVLRHAERSTRQLSCHTDWRSPKRRQLEVHSRASWLFYDRERKVQLRLRGQVVLQRGTSLARDRWNLSSTHSRVCYSSPLSPGAPIERPMGAPEDAEGGCRHFTVVICTVGSIDWLFLHAGGHRRAVLRWKRGNWTASWVSP